MKVGVLSKFKVASLNKQIQAPHQPGSTAGNKFHHHANYDEFSEFKQLQTVTIMTIMTIMAPPSTLRRRPIHLALFFGVRKSRSKHIARNIPETTGIFLNK